LDIEVRPSNKLLFAHSWRVRKGVSEDETAQGQGGAGRNVHRKKRRKTEKRWRRKVEKRKRLRKKAGGKTRKGQRRRTEGNAYDARFLFLCCWTFLGYTGFLWCLAPAPLSVGLLIGGLEVV